MEFEDIDQAMYLANKRKARKDKILDNFLSSIEKIPSPNFSSRQNKKINMIVLHYTGALRINGTIEWFKNPVSKVSSHYVIGRDGRIVQMVELDKKAWHAGYSYWKGQFSVNANSIGIELVGTEASGFTDDQMDSLVSLCSYLVNEYNIHLDDIVGHEHISGVNAQKILIEKGYPYPGKVDPGRFFPWNEFISNLESIVDEDKHISKNEIDDVDIYSPQKLMSQGSDKHDNTTIGLILDFFLCILNIFKGERNKLV